MDIEKMAVWMLKVTVRLLELFVYYITAWMIWDGYPWWGVALAMVFGVIAIQSYRQGRGKAEAFFKACRRTGKGTVLAYVVVLAMYGWEHAYTGSDAFALWSRPHASSLQRLTIELTFWMMGAIGLGVIARVSGAKNQPPAHNHRGARVIAAP
jgi:hypothetical protein